jgi:hypothetical protein
MQRIRLYLPILENFKVMKIYMNVAVVESMAKYSTIITSFPKYVLDNWKKNLINGRKGESFIGISHESDFEISLSIYKRLRKRKMPDFTWSQHQDLILVSHEFKNAVSHLMPDYVEWISVGSLNRKNYYLLNFAYQPDIFNMKESIYQTKEEFNRGMSKYLTQERGFDFKESDFENLSIPMSFFSITKHVFNLDEVVKCPLFFLPYHSFGLQAIYFTDQIMDIIENQSFCIEGNQHLVHTN